MQNFYIDGKKHLIHNNMKIKDYINSTKYRGCFVNFNDYKFIIDSNYVIKNDWKVTLFNKIFFDNYFYISDLAIHVMQIALLNLLSLNDTIKFEDFSINEKFFTFNFKYNKKLINNFEFLLTKEISNIIKKQYPISFNNNKKFELGKKNEFSINNKSFKCYLSHFTNIPSNFFIKVISISAVVSEDSSKICKIEGLVSESKEGINQKLITIKKERENDHRYINQKLMYYEFDNRIGAGLPIWTEYGKTLRDEIEKYLDELQIKRFLYNKIQTSPIGNINLYKTSEHLFHYKDTMFDAIKTEHSKYILRPMTCPHHCIYFDKKLLSYKELPYKLYETSPLFRYEKSGSLKGLERTRWMTLSDCHTFLAKEHISKHISEILKQLNIVFKTFDIKLSSYRLSIQDKKEKYAKNSDIDWESATKILESELIKNKVKYSIGYGDAAFYGPKIDVQIENALGFEATLATIQLDYFLPKKFDLSYVNNHGKKERPIIIHHSLIGTYERFISILMEQTKGYLPLRFSPLNFVIIPIDNTKHEYAKNIEFEIKNKGFRVITDFSDQRLGYKIRQYEILKPNYIIVIGDEEIKQNTISVRNTKTNNIQNISLSKFITKLIYEKN